MIRSRTVEIWVGIFVALGFGALLMLSLKVSNLAAFYDDGGYEIKAYFGNIGGLKVKSPVKMSGVRVGQVSSVRFDDSRYEALVTMKIDSKYNKIPLDTGASIFTAGLLGEQYIGLTVGGENEYLKNGDQLTLTQPAVILEQLIGKLLYQFASEGGK